MVVLSREHCCRECRDIRGSIRHFVANRNHVIYATFRNFTTCHRGQIQLSLWPPVQWKLINGIIAYYLLIIKMIIVFQLRLSNGLSNMRKLNNLRPSPLLNCDTEYSSFAFLMRNCSRGIRFFGKKINLQERMESTLRSSRNKLTNWVRMLGGSQGHQMC